MLEFKVSFKDEEEFNLGFFEDQSSMKVDFQDFVVEKKLMPHPEYEGPTEFTPSSQEQIIQTENLLVLTNITVKPIPSNYGLITWNGSFLTVS